jgi:hypothetical protein
VNAVDRAACEEPPSEREGARSAGRMSAISEETSAHLDRKSTRREELLTFSKERERASLFGKYLPPSCRRVGLQKAFIEVASQCTSVRYVSAIIRIIRRRCVVRTGSRFGPFPVSGSIVERARGRCSRCRLSRFFCAERTRFFPARLYLGLRRRQRDLTSLPSDSRDPTRKFFRTSARS